MLECEVPLSKMETGGGWRTYEGKSKGIHLTPYSGNSRNTVLGSVLFQLFPPDKGSIFTPKIAELAAKSIPGEKVPDIWRDFKGCTSMSNYHFAHAIHYCWNRLVLERREISSKKYEYRFRKESKSAMEKIVELSGINLI